GRGYGLQLPGFVRLGRGRENERGRFRSPTEDLMPDEDREEAEEGEAQAPPEGSAELSVIYDDHHDDGGQGYEGRTGERKADGSTRLEVPDGSSARDHGRLTIDGKRERGLPLLVRATGPPEKVHEPGERGQDGGDQEQLDGPARSGGPDCREGPRVRGRRVR